MRPELETYHLIDSYLNGKLEGEALRAFEHKIQSDPAFAEEVSFQQLTTEVVVGASYDTLRSQMTKDIESIDAADKTKKWSLYTVAAFVLITGVASFFWYAANKPDTKIDTTKESNTPTTYSSPTPGNKSTAESTNQKNNSIQHTVETNPTSGVKPEADIKGDTQTSVIALQHVQHIPVEKVPTNVKAIQPVEKPTEKPAAVNPCLTTQISAEITTKPSCSNENTGSILIPSEHLRGGAGPYTLALDHTPTRSIKESYLYLSAGTHSILITDKNGCSKEFQVSIEEKNCKKTSYVFAPEKGETWKISGNNNDAFTITLINLAGTQVYKSQLMQGEFEWQGIGQQGEYLSAGLYIYIIEYTNGKKENGQVTIVR